MRWLVRYPVFLLLGISFAGVWFYHNETRQHDVSRSLSVPAASIERDISNALKEIPKVIEPSPGVEPQPFVPSEELQSLRRQNEIQRDQIAALKALLVREEKLIEDLRAGIAKRDQRPSMLETLQNMWRDDGWGFLGLLCVVGQLSVWGGHIVFHLVRKMPRRPAPVTQTSLTMTRSQTD
jgi:hypothetical protein